jgi:hypothetical protein
MHRDRRKERQPAVLLHGLQTSFHTFETVCVSKLSQNFSTAFVSNMTAQMKVRNGD